MKRVAKKPRQPRAAKAKRYEILPLEWIVAPSVGLHRANCLLGSIFIKARGFVELCLPGEPKVECKTVKDAMNTAEAWYQQQLRRALREVSR